ncbi:MAG: hypothetical protein ABIY90_12150 [Puia sp.]
MNRKFLLYMLCIGFGFISCNPPASKSETGDSVVRQAIPPQADNSQATNPSLADTAFSKKGNLDSGRTGK